MPGKKQLQEPAARAFDPGVGRGDEELRERKIEKLHAKIGQLTVERDFLARRLRNGSRICALPGDNPAADRSGSVIRSTKVRCGAKAVVRV